MHFHWYKIDFNNIDEPLDELSNKLNMAYNDDKLRVFLNKNICTIISQAIIYIYIFILPTS